MDNAEETLIRQIAWFNLQIKKTGQPAADALDELNQASTAFEEVRSYARHSLTSPLGCLVCAITFFMLSWICAREFGLFEYINVRLISVQIVRGGSNSAAFWYLMWPFSILLSWALVPVFRSHGPFNAKNKVWTGLPGTFASLQSFGVLSCFYAAFDRIQDPSREVLESFGQNSGVAILLLALLQILLLGVSNKRTAEVKAATDRLESARLNYCEKSTIFVDSYWRFVVFSKELMALKEEKKRQEEARKRAEEAEKERQAEATRKERERREAEERRRAEEQARKKRQEEERQRQARRKSREQFFTERLGKKAGTANAMRAHWQTDVNIHERNSAYDGLFRLFVRFNLNRQELDEYLTYPYKQAA